MGLFRSSRRKIQEKTAASWGKIKEKRRNFDLISRYAATGTGSAFYRLTDQTLSDIDVEDLFACIDRTETGIGQQVLFHTLLHPTNDIEALKVTHQLSDYFYRIHKSEKIFNIIYTAWSRAAPTLLSICLHPGGRIKGKTPFTKPWHLPLQHLQCLVYLYILYSHCLLFCSS